LQPPQAPMTEQPPQPLPANPRLPQQQQAMDPQQTMREAMVMHLLKHAATTVRIRVAAGVTPAPCRGCY
jgi:hypothetical protein